MARNDNKAYTADYFAQYDSTINNGEARIPICFCIDTSASMGFITNRPEDFVEKAGSEHMVDGSNAVSVEFLPGRTPRYRWQELQRVLQKMLMRIKQNPVISNAAVVSVITFDRFSDCVVEFSDIHRLNPERVVEGVRARNGSNDTNAGKGLSMALERLDQFKRMNSDAGNESYKPVLIFMSDGQPTDRAEAERLGNIVRERSEGEKLNVIPIAIGRDVDESWMRHLSKESYVFHMNYEDEFDRVFDIITRRITYTAMVIPVDEGLNKAGNEEKREEGASSQYGEETSIEDAMEDLLKYMNDDM